MNKELFIAAAAIYQTLFSKKTIGHWDEETSTTILNDIFTRDFGFLPEEEREQIVNERDNIVASVDFVHLLGWKNHESL